MPRPVAWVGAAVSIALILLCLMALAGCKIGLHDPRRHHGGTVNDNKGIFTCADGTVK